MTKYPLSPIQLHLSPVAALRRTTDLLVLNYLPGAVVFTTIRVVSVSVQYRDLGSSPNAPLLSQPPATSKSMAHVRRDDADDDRDQEVDSVPEFWLSSSLAFYPLVPSIAASVSHSSSLHRFLSLSLTRDCPPYFHMFRLDPRHTDTDLPRPARPLISPKSLLTDNGMSMQDDTRENDAKLRFSTATRHPAIRRGCIRVTGYPRDRISVTAPAADGGWSLQPPSSTTSIHPSANPSLIHPFPPPIVFCKCTHTVLRLLGDVVDEEGGEIVA
ncbi:hypothetical protein SISNIDRAFT_467323 [Sistotremastrum niveocremeum HHB9708]|uniref:Uncharacterized protein n=1 Tax=Sistotremastrum niveocremeum HHB9708 TaxID=1314777 RepID=A0A164SQZ2_9AGAM|nr:hypothetical protein SISNIDRAFT_467323 [Sistotremastrum niveocremeum HHB9708]